MKKIVLLIFLSFFFLSYHPAYAQVSKDSVLKWEFIKLKDTLALDSLQFEKFMDMQTRHHAAVASIQSSSMIDTNKPAKLESLLTELDIKLQLLLNMHQYNLYKSIKEAQRQRFLLRMQQKGIPVKEISQ